MAAADYARWARADWGFHERVAQASGNPLLHELYVSFGDVFHNDLLKQQRRSGFNGLPHEGHGGSWTPSKRTMPTTLWPA